MNLGKKVLLVTIGISLLIIILLSIKRLYKIMARIGVALVVDGLIFIVIKSYINKNVQINSITIFNDALSEVLRNIINDILKNFTIYGLILLSIGIILILIYAINKGISKTKREEAKYTKED